eukprot:gb/GECG01001247.1/.p1 GENE.gb/GECG01001247.1/~~gb/GECG01001247.1/.p1  ORF type:complete len:596 (+),score=65.48 gb/GECG01001247.1/:1-1788(+)
MTLRKVVCIVAVCAVLAQAIFFARWLSLGGTSNESLHDGNSLLSSNYQISGISGKTMHNQQRQPQTAPRNTFSWMGGLTSTSVTIVIGFTDFDPLHGEILEGGIRNAFEENPDRVLKKAPKTAYISVTQEGAGNVVYSRTVEVDPDFGTARFQVSRLSPETLYEYTGGAENSEWRTTETGRFRTSPKAKECSKFRIAFSSCAITGSRHPVFSRIADHDPLLFIHMGDLFYGGIRSNFPIKYMRKYWRSLTSPTQRDLFTRVPVVYMWDDHDYGTDDSDGTNDAAKAASITYKHVAPYYTIESDAKGKWSKKQEATSWDSLANKCPEQFKDEFRKAAEKIHHGNAIYHSFSISRVRFLVTDLRSQRIPDSFPDEECKTMLGPIQLQWFKEELLAAYKSTDIDLIVWVNTVPYLSGRGWGLFSHEKHEILEYIHKHRIRQKLIVISGDAHMLAAENGKESDIGFPVFHAAALDSPGNVKGGPYSHGAYPGRGQYGILDIEYEDDSRPGFVGLRACVVYSGMRVSTSGEEERVFRYSTCQGVHWTSSTTGVRDEYNWVKGYLHVIGRGIWRLVAASFDQASAFAFLDAVLATSKELRH